MHYGSPSNQEQPLGWNDRSMHRKKLLLLLGQVALHYKLAKNCNIIKWWLCNMTKSPVSMYRISFSDFSFPPEIDDFILIIFETCPLDPIMVKVIFQSSVDSQGVLISGVWTECESRFSVQYWSTRSSRYYTCSLNRMWKSLIHKEFYVLNLLSKLDVNVVFQLNVDPRGVLVLRYVP